LCGCKNKKEPITLNSSTEAVYFTYIKIDTAGPLNPWAKFSGDLDGDGVADIIVGGQNGPLVWYKYPDWTKHKISDGGYNTVDGDVADLDQDSDPDITIGGIWYENMTSDGRVTFTEHRFADWYPNACVQVADINKDGRNDIVLTPSELAGSYYRISWFEAPRDLIKGEWMEHFIADSVECVIHSLALGDLDNDGSVDIAYAEMHQGVDPDEVVVLLNRQNGQSWKKQVISQKGSHGLRMEDINNDGLLDLFGANWSSDYQPIVAWLNTSANEIR